MNKMTQNNTPSSAGMQPTVTEYSIRVPKTTKNKHHVMRFNYNLNVDFSQWRTVKMERENNLREFKMTEEDLPKFGAGSEYNRDQKEEARRKKFGIIAKKYNPDNQPWILKVGSGSKTGKKFRGIREGGVSENAAHFVFTQTKDGSIEAVPLNEWYNFQPIQRYKALTAEEAEEEFGRRKKCVNMWTMKMRMKLKNKDDEEPELDPEDAKAAKGSKGGDKKKLQISEMDEWMDSDDMSSSEEEGDEKKKEEEDSDKEAKAKIKKGKLQNLKKKKRDVDDEAFEDSDDGDEEGRERDYISDSSESDSEPEGKANKELKSVAEEDALRKLLTSDEDSDEEKSNKDENESDQEQKKKEEAAQTSKESEAKAEKVKEKKKDDKKSKMQKFYDAINQAPGTGHASDFSSDSDDSGNEKSPKKKKKIEKSAHNSTSGTPVDASPASSPAIKRKAEIVNNSDNSNSPQSTPAKKIKTESAPTSFSSFSASKSDSLSSTEEAVRRYLMRKPMTTTELLKKIQSKKTGVSSDELVEMMTAILKKINPSKQRIQGKMYLSLKAT